MDRILLSTAPPSASRAASQVASQAAPRARQAPRGLIGRLLALAALRRQRRSLAALDAHLLRDLGLTRDEALREARRPLWDAPDHWLR